MPGSKPGERRGGRQKGTRNKISSEIVAAAQAGGMMPLDYMLSVMRNETADERRRDTMAAAAAPYLHKKQGVDESGTPTTVINGQVSSIQVSFVKPNHKDDDDE